MRKILIVPSNTDLNRGDQSLTWASISIAKEIFDEEIDIFLYRAKGKLADQTKTNHQTEKLGYPFLTRILSHPRRNDTKNEVKFSIPIKIKWGSRAFLDIIVTTLLLSRFRFINKLGTLFLDDEQIHTYNFFEKLDGLLVKGGGFLHSYGSFLDPYTMYFQLFDVFLAKKFNVPVFILPNSIGPLKNNLAKKIVLRALKYAKVIFVREGTSLNYLRGQGIEANQSPDLGFYLNPSPECFRTYLEEKGVPVKRKKCIAITLRPYRFDGEDNSDELFENYLNEVKTLVERLLENDLSVTLMAHTIGPSAHEDDTIPLLEIYKRITRTQNLIFLNDRNLNSEDIEKIYSYYDLVIGTRFHSVIFALNVNTPAVAIAYGGNKAVGIMKDMDLSEFVVPIENPNADKLFEISNKALSNRQTYITKIEKYKIKLKNERSLLINKIREHYN